MRKLGLSIALLAVVAVAAQAAEVPPRVVRVTIRTLGSELKTVNWNPAHSGKAPGAMPSRLIPRKIHSAFLPGEVEDTLTVSVISGSYGALRVEKSPTAATELSFEPTLNADSSVSLVVTFERRSQGKLVGKAQVAKARLQKGGLLLVSPEPGSILAFTVEDYLDPGASITPLDL